MSPKNQWNMTHDENTQDVLHVLPQLSHRMCGIIVNQTLLNVMKESELDQAHHSTIETSSILKNRRHIRRYLFYRCLSKNCAINLLSNHQSSLINCSPESFQTSRVSLC